MGNQKMMRIKIIVLVSLLVTGVSQAAAENLAVDESRTKGAIDFLKTACAAGETVEVSTSGSAGLSFIKKGATGEFSFKSEDARGIVNGLRDELQHQNLQNIRSCMEPHINKILNAILGLPETNNGSPQPCSAASNKGSVVKGKLYDIKVLKCSLDASLMECIFQIKKNQGKHDNATLSAKSSSILDQQGNEVFANFAQIGSSSGDYVQREFLPGESVLGKVRFDLSSSQPFPFSQQDTLQSVRIYFDGNPLRFKDVNVCNLN